MEAEDRRKEESLLPPDYVSLAQLQKLWLQSQEEKKMKQKQEEENKNKEPNPPIGDSHQSGVAIACGEETVAVQSENPRRGGKEEVKQEITAKEKRKKKSKKKIPSVEEGEGVGDVLPMNRESKRVSGVNRRGIGRTRIKGGGDVRGSGNGIRRENSLKSSYEVGNDKKWSKTDDTLEVKEGGTKSEKEVIAVCNAIYRLNTDDGYGTKDPRIGENVASEEEDKVIETKGGSHHEKGRVGSGKISTLKAVNDDKHSETMSENYYHLKVRVGNGSRRGWGPRGGYRSSMPTDRNGGTMRSGVEMNVGCGRGAYANMGRFGRGKIREGNRHMVWMKKEEKLSTDSTEEGSSGALADQD